MRTILSSYTGHSKTCTWKCCLVGWWFGLVVSHWFLRSMKLLYTNHMPPSKPSCNINNHQGLHTFHHSHPSSPNSNHDISLVFAPFKGSATSFPRDSADPGWTSPVSDLSQSGHQCFKLLSMLRHRKATSLQKTWFNHTQRFSVRIKDDKNHKETGWPMFNSKMTVIQMNVCWHMHRREVLHWLIDLVQVLRHTQHKICHFGDVPQANLLASYGKTKPNTTKAHIHQSKEMHNNTK